MQFSCMECDGLYKVMSVFIECVHENVEVNFKEEIEVKEEPINIKSVEINIAKDIVIYDEPIAFPWESHLVKHELTHTEEKLYQCSICDKTFSQNCLLIKHEIVHLKEKPYKCSPCDKTFTCKKFSCNTSDSTHWRETISMRPM
ncbi:unnamed protein product [Meganyctiphanes norvegica]|uniref:C2H2-type domain-containing protein n=1 Tax=Meganyctiphanes norvegica TaxID=48144 RepID=A0AAV2R0J9_MEGNR